MNKNESTREGIKLTSHFLLKAIIAMEMMQIMKAPLIMLPEFPPSK